MKKLLAVLLGLALVITMAACGGGSALRGTYTDASGMVSQSFSGGKLTTNMGGWIVESTYELKDGVMVITDADGEVTQAPYSLDGKTLTIDGVEYYKK